MKYAGKKINNEKLTRLKLTGMYVGNWATGTTKTNMSKKYVLDCEQSNYSSSSHYLIEPEMAPFDLWPKNPTYRIGL